MSDLVRGVCDLRGKMKALFLEPKGKKERIIFSCLV